MFSAKLQRWRCLNLKICSCFLGLSGGDHFCAFPRARVRLSAGRSRLSREAQALCCFAGANSIFYGNKLLTAQNPEADADHELLRDLGLTPQQPFSDSPPPAAIAASGGVIIRSPDNFHRGGITLAVREGFRDSPHATKPHNPLA